MRVSNALSLIRTRPKGLLDGYEEIAENPAELIAEDLIENVAEHVIEEMVVLDPFNEVDDDEE